MGAGLAPSPRIEQAPKREKGPGSSTDPHDAKTKEPEQSSGSWTPYATRGLLYLGGLLASGLQALDRGGHALVQRLHAVLHRGRNDLGHAADFGHVGFQRRRWLRRRASNRPSPGRPGLPRPWGRR